METIFCFFSSSPFGMMTGDDLRTTATQFQYCLLAIKGSLVCKTSVLRTFNSCSTTTHHTPLIIHHSSNHHSSYTTHHTPLIKPPLIIHHSSCTTHHTPLIIHHSSYTTHHAPLIMHHSSAPVSSSFRPQHWAILSKAMPGQKAQWWQVG